MRNSALVFVSAMAMALAVASCGKKDEPAKTTTAPPRTIAPAPPPAAAAGVAVTTVTVGNAIGADKQVQGGATIVPKDTIYVSVATTGSGEASLKSRWTYLKDGKTTMVKEDTQKVSTTGPATHEFHISKPDGWPKGEYQVEVFVNDASAGTKRFSVS